MLGMQYILKSSITEVPLKVDVSNEEFVSSENMDEVMFVINSIDFTSISYKLEKEYGWSKEALMRAEPLYRQWLGLQAFYKDLSFAPSELVDEYWHMHILDTRKYMEDCKLIFGEYLHHYPYFGLTENEPKEILDRGFKLTKKLYRHHFGHDNLGMGEYKSASCGCRSGNGGSCR